MSFFNELTTLLDAGAAGQTKQKNTKQQIPVHRPKTAVSQPKNHRPHQEPVPGLSVQQVAAIQADVETYKKEA